MLNKFPQALTLVLIHYRYSTFLRLLNGWPYFNVIPSFISFGQRVQLIVSIQVDIFIILGKIHIAICENMINEQLIVKVNWISINLVRSMRIYFPVDL